VPDTTGSEPARLVTLTLPGERRYVGIVRLFVGGLSARLDLGYETMDDLQLALESILLQSESRREITLEARIEDGAVSILVGPFDRDPLLADASRPGSLEPERLLTALVAGVESTAQDGGHWLRLDVRVPAGSGSA
jgi:anti-sigma regulatory factor (Ser/Thr protein kinase)